MMAERRQDRIGDLLQRRQLLQREVLAVPRGTVQGDDVTAVLLTMQQNAPAYRVTGLLRLARDRARLQVDQLGILGIDDPADDRGIRLVTPRRAAPATQALDRRHRAPLLVERPVARLGHVDRHVVVDQAVNARQEIVGTAVGDHLPDLREKIVQFSHSSETACTQRLPSIGLAVAQASRADRARDTAAAHEAPLPAVMLSLHDHVDARHDKTGEIIGIIAFLSFNSIISPYKISQTNRPTQAFIQNQ